MKLIFSISIFLFTAVGFAQEAHTGNKEPKLQVLINNCISGESFKIDETEYQGVFFNSYEYNGEITCSGASAVALYNYLGNLVPDRIGKVDGNVDFIMRKVSEDSWCQVSLNYENSHFCVLRLKIDEDILERGFRAE